MGPASIPKEGRAARIHPCYSRSQTNPSSAAETKKQMHRPMAKRPMGNQIQHPKNTKNLKRPVCQIQSHQTEPGPDNVRKAGSTPTGPSSIFTTTRVLARGISLDQTALTIAARKGPRAEAETCDASTACNPAGKNFSQTRPSLA